MKKYIKPSLMGIEYAAAQTIMTGSKDSDFGGDTLQGGVSGGGTVGGGLSGSNRGSDWADYEK